MWPLAAVGFVAIALASLWWLPEVLVRSAMESTPTDPNASGPLKWPSLTEYATAVTNARQGVLWAVGGLIATVTLLITWARHALDQDANRTTRYTEAIKQLGDDSISIRLGGIYALERIAQDSVRDHQTILDVLCAFIREVSPSTVDGEDVAGPIRSDVAAAATVVGRLSSLPPPSTVIDLSDTNLRNADFTGANLARARFNGSILEGANLSRANLTKADLINADLKHADFAAADLTHATLSDSNLQGVDLTDAKLNRANLFGANLLGARFNRTDLTMTNLVTANLASTVFVNANLTGAELLDANLLNARLDGTKLIGAHFLGANLTGLYVRHDEPTEDIPFVRIPITVNDLKRAGAIGIENTVGLPQEGDAEIPIPTGGN